MSSASVEHPGSTALAEKERYKLRRFNLTMGSVHLIQAMVMLAISSDFALPVTSSFLTYNPTTEVLRPDPQEMFSVRIGPMVAAFLFLSALAHFAIAAPRVNDWYSRNIGLGMNPARWMEYSLSSSLMIVVIAMLTGLYDVAALTLIFALNATMILFGWVMEVHNQTTRKTNWLSYWFGCFAGAIPWVAVGIYLIGATPGPPDFVYWIYGSMFVFFNIFAVNMVLQYKGVGRWRNYLYGERAYIWLSLVAKSLLAWQVFAGTLRPS
jgi:hypothetical protein